MVKVQWIPRIVEEAASDMEPQMREKYPNIFEPSGMPLFYFRG